MEPSFLVNAVTWAVPLIIAITFHEAAHGFIAYRLGDPTAYERGRVTFNPFKHVDPFGTVILPGLLFIGNAPFLFGYAKPVPVDFRRLRRLRRDMFFVAFAGPGINIILCAACAVLLHLEAWVTPEESPWLYLMLYRGIMVNAVLAMFNLLPLLPLDGGRMVYSLLPRSLQARYGRTERFGMAFIFALFLIPPLLAHYFSLSLPVGEYLVLKPALWLVEWVLRLTGNAL